MRHKSFKKSALLSAAGNRARHQAARAIQAKKEGLMARHGDATALRVLRTMIAKAGIFFTLLLAASLASAGSVNLAWDAVSSSSLAGYKIHYGSAAGSYTAALDVGNRTSYTVPNLTDGATYYFAVTAYDTARSESGFSNQVSAKVAAAAPVASFSASATTGVAPLALNFVNSSTGSITSYKWTFGDGTTSTAQSPTHTYNAAGKYSVSLTVTGPGGSNTQTRADYINVSGTATAPVASFTADKTSGAAPLAVQFRSTSTGTISSYSWKFGDGTTSTAQNPLHTYSTAGTYTVALTVSGSAGSNTKTMTSYITVSTSGSTACPCSIWPASAVPRVAADPDAVPVELGMKFKADRSGYVTGVRFYKSTKNTGTHVGSLWTTSGKLLARATFSNETASGWQQVNFATPVAVAANTVYVVSYHTNVGHYAGDTNYFVNGVDRGPLHALPSSAAGGNGVYRYSSTPGFPTSSYASSNYWVDVVFR
jgi:PKD repeat protein